MPGDIFDSLDIFDKVAQKPQSVADAARQRLASRGLTPEAVKAGKGVTSPDQITFDPAKEVNGGFGGGFLSGLNPINAVDAGLEAAQNFTVMGNRDPSFGDMANVIGVPSLPAIAQESSRRGAANESTADMYGGTAAAAATFGAMKALPHVSSLAGGISAPDAAANLINRYLGDGAIDTTLGKNAGRGISRAKIVAATAEGVQKGVQQSIADGQAVLKRLLDTPQAQAPTIDGTQLIRNAFGDPPLNITGATLGRWEEFAGNIAQKIHDVSDGTMQLSPAQVDSLKGDIDVQFGKLSADATELNMNQKAGSVRRAFDNAVDRNVHGYKELNDHLSDLHHADAVLTEKIAQNATTKPLGLSTVADPIRSFVGTPMSSKGTRPGIMTTPGRTMLAAMLSDRVAALGGPAPSSFFDPNMPKGPSVPLLPAGNPGPGTMGNPGQWVRLGDPPMLGPDTGTANQPTGQWINPSLNPNRAIGPMTGPSVQPTSGINWRQGHGGVMAAGQEPALLNLLELAIQKYQGR